MFVATAMNVSEATEIRKLSPTDKLELVRLLHENWKILMSKIPEKLEKENYESVVRVDSTPKYNSNDIRLVERASTTDKRLPCDILFEEWGSSGRIRPTLGHLFFLLQACKLYGAADYVAKILRINPPQRPNFGPAAKIELTPEERRQISDSSTDIRIVLNEMNYPSITGEHSMTENTRNTSHIDVDVRDSVQSVDTLSEVNCRAESISDMIEWSSKKIPRFSNLLNSEKSDNAIFQSLDTDGVPSVVPPFSTLLEESSQSRNTNYNLPDFDALKSSTSLIVSQSISVPRLSGSPLPSLSLNTLLKHYSYAELEVATNYFNETPYVNTGSRTFSTACGRLLGSGAFSSVYLAFGLVVKPVAVKRLNLKNLNIVTKQFTTEVEMFYKYKHEHLVPLLGYSCDGMAYCLLYEYVPGGNLRNRLECTENVLTWRERFRVAMGTANAIAYLHTASSPPLVHRDIKSANILLDAANHPKLCDFGIIRIASSTTTSTNQIAGTSAYMPPEAHRGDVSVKMDTYSFGVVLLELITGLPPVDYDRNGNDIVTYVQDNLEDEGGITSLLDVKAGTWEDDAVNFGDELYKIALKCLQERKNFRPTMVDVRDQLSKLVRNIKSTW